MMSHPSPNATMVLKSNYIDVLWGRYASFNELPENYQMNAGYVDGHVQSYWAEETMGMQRNVPRIFFIPEDWY